MSNVSAIKPAVKATIDDVAQFADNLRERGDCPANTARLRVTALRQLTSVLQPDEPSDPESLLKELEDIGRRFAIKNPQIKAKTVRTYMVRARGLLEDYVRYVEDPTNFKVRTKVSRPRRQKQDSAPPTKSATNSAPMADSPAGDQLRTFPLSNGRSVQFVLPEGWTREDAALFMCHVFTLAQDFHPRDLQRFNFGE